MNRIFRISAVVAILAAFPFTVVSGASISLKLKVDTADLGFRDSESGGVLLVVKGFDHLNYLDYPGLPYRVVNILLPQGEIVSSYDIEVLDMIEVDPAIDLAGFEGDLLEDGSKAGIIAAADEVTRDGTVFPKWKVRHIGTNNYRGFRVASFAVYPFSG
jgi:hypothetical protein